MTFKQYSVLVVIMLVSAFLYTVTLMSGTLIAMALMEWSLSYFLYGLGFLVVGWKGFSFCDDMFYRTRYNFAMQELYRSVSSGKPLSNYSKNVLESREEV